MQRRFFARLPTLASATVFSFCIALTAAAEDAYAPDVMEFDGATTIGAEPDPAFLPADAFTIEFWAAAGWDDDPGYDPVVLGNNSPESVIYSVSILRDRDGVGVLIGEKEFLAAYDFSDGRLHHIAIVMADGALAIVVDGQVRANFEAAAPMGASDGVWVGSLDGEAAPFTGSIGQIRFWRAALNLESLVEFALADIMSETNGDHPYIDDIAAISDLTAPLLLIAENSPS